MNRPRLTLQARRLSVVSASPRSTSAHEPTQTPRSRLRRLIAHHRVVWEPSLQVQRSSRRLNQGGWRCYSLAPASYDSIRVHSLIQLFPCESCRLASCSDFDARASCDAATADPPRRAHLRACGWKSLHLDPIRTLTSVFTSQAPPLVGSSRFGSFGCHARSAFASCT